MAATSWIAAQQLLPSTSNQLSLERSVLHCSHCHIFFSFFQKINCRIADVFMTRFFFAHETKVSDLRLISYLRSILCSRKRKELQGSRSTQQLSFFICVKFHKFNFVLYHSVNRKELLYPMTICMLSVTYETISVFPNASLRNLAQPIIMKIKSETYSAVFSSFFRFGAE